MLDGIFSPVCNIKKHDRVFQNKIEGNDACVALSFGQNLNENIKKIVRQWTECIKNQGAPLKYDVYVRSLHLS